METFGSLIKNLRESKKLPLRVVSAYLDIDQAILSKIERDLRKANRDLVIKLSTYFEIDKNELLVAWLSDKLVLELEDEEIALKALQLAEEKVIYHTKKASSINIIDSIKKTLAFDGRVNMAWLFGSVARGEDNPKSDIDLMVELKDDKKYSMFDLLDLEYILGKPINRKIDLVEKGYLKEFSLQSADNDLIKIYG
ncbi:MAG: nucleotidyltransferase domain-containing protein [Bacteroidetes bacterium]|nr:nucleotidyltransferase domain-containing protein [Bacteroidota bacterium]MBU1484716.1 nucleotidyltransferase domain-containing protein [Bacteroidota bacterium]MBU1760107.1 nucleotidyltransferase domain-containing protein [Bacteroidota bacterium]MBU2045226.1 nucleotidyltransferase domain-containing protein [Bacteroidota bacterium]MBU2375010.1 nucleotidyltransferase domain-containing protein [Bacteroidota bacterium]